MSQMFEVEAQPDQVLIAEGDVDADNFYIVQGGKYEVTLLRRPGEVVHTYRNPGVHPNPNPKPNPDPDPNPNPSPTPSPSPNPKQLA